MQNSINNQIISFSEIDVAGARELRSRDGASDQPETAPKRRRIRTKTNVRDLPQQYTVQSFDIVQFQEPQQTSLNLPTYTSRVINCPRINSQGSTCGGSKETAHMQLYTLEGYRNIVCPKCPRGRNQHRAAKWLCEHGIAWHRCPEHRIDPDQHATTRVANRISKQMRASALLPHDRPMPNPKRCKQSVTCRTAVKRKRVVQSAHPEVNSLKPFSVDLSKCPKLAVKFPHLYRGCEEHVQHYSSTATGAACVNAGSSGPVRMSERGDATSIRATTGALL